MTKNKFKVFLISLSTIAVFATGSLALAPLSSCSTSNRKTDDIDDGIDYVIGQDEATADVWTVKFLTGGQTDVQIIGSSQFTIKNGKPLATLAIPQAIKKGYKFLGWCEDLTKPEQIVSLSTPVTSDMTLYPSFKKPIELQDTVNLTFIEETNLWFEDGVAKETTIKYSDDYGRNFDKTLPETEAEALTFHPGDNIFLISENPEGFSSTTDQNRIRFSTNGSVNIGGSIMGLIDGGEGTSKSTIPAESVNCFANAFAGNAAIKYVSDTFLPATALAASCYVSMFEGCTNLKLVPSLPATTLAEKCYQSMFKNCTSLDMVNIKYLGNITSEQDGYFYGWLSGIQTVGQLIYGNSSGTVTEKPASWNVIAPTKTIDVRCVDDNLVEPFVVDHPYHFKAFEGTASDAPECKNITWVSSNTDVASVNPDTGVVTPIRANGASEECFIKAYSKLDWQVVGQRKITVREIYKDPTKDTMGLMTVKATEDNTTISWDFIGAGAVPNFKWSTDGHSWRKLWSGSAQKITKGQTIYVKGNNVNGLNGGNDTYGSKSHTTFTFTGKVEIGGNIMGLIDDGRSEITNIPTEYCFNNLFAVNNAVTSVSANFLKKATTLTKGCYYAMFSSCFGLTSAPDLPAATLKDNCYEHMFFNCTSLETSPSLSSATTLAEYCYSAMFYASGLTSTPALPVTTPAKGCYYMMFQYCEKIGHVWKNIGPVDLETVLDYSCYQMFAGIYYYVSPWENCRMFYDQDCHEETWSEFFWQGYGAFYHKGQKVFTCPSLKDPSGNELKEPVTRMFYYIYLNSIGYEDYHISYTLTEGTVYYR